MEVLIFFEPRPTTSKGSTFVLADLWDYVDQSQSTFGPPSLHCEIKATGTRSPLIVMRWRQNNLRSILEICRKSSS